MKITSRQPTHSEAVEIILRSKTRHFRKAQLDYWRDLYGDEWADAVASAVRAVWGKK